MRKVPDSALAVIKEYDMLSRGTRVVVGLSGGADSVCLLHVLLWLREEYELEISAVHVNHGIRGAESDADENFVFALCQKLGIELDVCHYDVPHEAMRMGLTLEEAGRVLRYQSFEKSLQKRSGNKIAVAHNQNDNAETVLMRVFRGTGMKGLAGIPPARENIIRPLITTSRTEIEHFCQENNLSYRTDSTNLNNIYTRNFIRLDLLPLAEERLSSATLENISRMTRIIAEEEEYLNGIAMDALRHCAPDSSSLSIPLLVEYPVVLRRRIIRLFLLPHTKENRDISYEHVNMALGLLSKKTGSEICLPFGLRLKRSYALLYIPSKPAAAFRYELPLDTAIFISESRVSILSSFKKTDNYFENSCTKIFSYDKIGGALHVRSRQAGDKIYVQSMGGNKKIKDYFIDAKIPQAKRDAVPLLVCGDDVLWIMDDINIISDLYKVCDHTQHKIYISKIGGAIRE